MPSDGVALVSRVELVRSLGSININTRGLADSKPKRVNLAKTAATMLQTVMDDVNDCFLLCNEPVDDLISLSTMLAPQVHLVNLLCTFANMIELVGRQVGSFAIAAVGSPEPLPVRHNLFSEQMAFKLRRDVIESVVHQLPQMIQSSPSSHQIQRDLVIQEKPGRFQVLDLFQQSRKTAIKRARVMATDFQKANLDRLAGLASGYGFGAVALLEDGKTETRLSISLTQLSAQSSVNFDFFESFALILRERYLRHDDAFFVIGAHFQDVFQLVQAIGEAAGTYSLAQLEVPDCLWGFHPILSFMEAIARPPACLVSLYNFPRIDVVEVRHAP